MPDKESTGGPAACEPPFVAQLRRTGVQVEEEVYAHAGRAAQTGLRARVARVLRTAQTLRRRLNEGHFDLVHLNTSFDTKALLRDAVTLHFLRSSGSKIFLKFHGSDAALLQTRNALLRQLGSYLLSHANGIGVLSSEERDNFIRAGANEHKVFVVKNVVSEALAQRTLSFAERLGLKTDAPVLLFIARFIPAKGLIDVIRACQSLRQRGQEYVLLCVGDGPARADAEREVAQAGLESQVRFCGFIPEERTGEFYANSTMLLFPTYHYEGFPMVIFNSAAAGIPIITTRIRAAADYLREPDNCLWVEPRNPAMLAEKISYLLAHPEVCEMMSRNNKELAQRFTAEVVTQEYIEIYKQLAQARPAIL